MTASDQPHPGKSLLDFRLSRRTALVSAGVGIAGAIGLANSASAATANYSVIPRLPGEISRLATQYSTAGNPYESIDVANAGDKARLFVPWSSPPSKKGLTAIWFYHSNGGDRTALSNVYGYSAAIMVDTGVVSICPDYGGSLWTTQPAIDHQARWAAWMAANFSVATAFSRAHSGGGPLMCWAYGRSMIPALRGIYMVNAAYDMNDVYNRDPLRTPPIYHYSRSSMEKTNPARLPVSSWTGKRIRVIVSETDLFCPPSKHGIALIHRAAPVAASTSARWHDQGHEVPSFVHSDMVATFDSWS